MGLSMSLYRRRFVQAETVLSPDEQTTVTLTIKGKVVPLVEPTYLSENVAHWLRANAIHGFFRALTSGHEDGSYVVVEVEDLEDLVSRCRQALADHALAPSLLPVEDGPLFGGNEYNERYFEVLQDTIAMLDPVIAAADSADHEYVYEASW